MINFLDNIEDADSHLEKLDQAIEHHCLTDVLEAHQGASFAKESAKNEASKETRVDFSGADQRKQQIITELERELLYLGLKEGQGMETKDIDNGNIDYRGTLSKRIKDGLDMEYTFSSQSQHIKNFHLNNIEFDLKDMPEDKLSKLYVITKFINEQYRQKKTDETGDKKLSKEEEELLRKKEEEARQRQRVLEQL